MKTKIKIIFLSKILIANHFSDNAERIPMNSGSPRKQNTKFDKLEV